MTSGERMLFAVAFDRAMTAGMPPQHAAFVARRRVEDLRSADALSEGDERTQATIDDMLSTGGDR